MSYSFKSVVLFLKILVTLVLSRGYKYECLTGDDILSSNQQQIIEQARFTYSPLGKASEKQIKTIED